MGAKSRGNFAIPFCIRAAKCSNKGNKCGKCIRYSQFTPAGYGKQFEIFSKRGTK